MGAWISRGGGQRGGGVAQELEGAGADAAQKGGHGVGVGGRLHAVLGRGVAPLVFEVAGAGGEIAAVAQGGLLVERVGGGEFFEVAGVELGGDAHHFDVNAITRRGEGAAITEEEADVTGALAVGGEGVAVHGGVGIGDGGEG